MRSFPAFPEQAALEKPRLGFLDFRSIAVISGDSGRAASGQAGLAKPAGRLGNVFGFLFTGTFHREASVDSLKLA